MLKQAVALVAVAAILLTGVAAVNASYESAGPHTDIQNESWTPNAGSTTSLDHSNVDSVFYDETVVVQNASGVHSTDGVDYEWYPSNGTIKTLSGGNLDGETTATITYGYSTPTHLQRQLASLWGNMLNLSAFMLVVPAIGLVVLALRTLGGV